MRIIDLSNYKSEKNCLIPFKMIDNKVILIMSDFYLKNDIYLEYDIETQKMAPIIAHQDTDNGVIKVIKSGISEDYIYHVILEKSTDHYDIIGIYKLLIKDMSVIKVHDLRLEKSERYENFSDFSNAFVWLGEIDINKLLIKCSNSHEPESKVNYYYKDLNTNSFNELNSKFTSKDLRFYGKVKDENGEYYVFRTGNFGSVDDRRYVIDCGHEYEYLKDKIIVVNKTDFESSQLYNEIDYTLIDSANENQGIDSVWLVKNKIHYFKESVLDDKLEHFVFDFHNKTKTRKQGKLANLLPILNDGISIYCNKFDSIIEAINDDGEIVFSIKTSEFNERIEDIFSNYILVGSCDSPYLKRIYDINTRNCVGEYLVNTHKYFVEDDTLVIC